MPTDRLSLPIEPWKCYLLLARRRLRLLRRLPRRSRRRSDRPRRRTTASRRRAVPRPLLLTPAIASDAVEHPVVGRLQLPLTGSRPCLVQVPTKLCYVGVVTAELL